ncbi:peptide/nickel transport system substrate-binding protein [Streptomyces africanus]|uniref:Peptide/nickel transport system substrate-binding protein n=1 Tax=Streptomyces africanus TaxID=231024 RepID=A0ABU0QX72_9ACTN|nr:peptide/nickel transport system substrate-binding protein [Streptomyces africanus]
MRQPSVTARRVAAASVSLVLAAGAAACGPKDNDAKGAGGDSTPHKGGTLTVLNADAQQDFDPARLYTSGGGNVPSLVFRTLTTRNRENGAAGTEVVPDLATDTGRPSKGATVWTYTLKKGLTYEDGTPITSADIKYGIERSFAPELSGGAPYLRDWLVGAAGYQGPYKDKKGLDAIETPDERTIVFHLNKPEGEFPYLATQTQFTPVPKSKDTGTKYEEHPVSSGPYRVVRNENDGERLVLERNTHWSASTDAERKAYPDRIDVRSGLDSSVINQRLSASRGADAAAVTTDTNLGPAELAKVTGDKDLASRVGTGHFGYTNYLAFNPAVKPFNDVKVRQAISYAIDRSSVVNAAGGSALAEPATTFLPDQKSFGYTPYDLLPGEQERRPGQGQAAAEGGRPPERAHRHADALQRQGLRDQPGDRDRRPGRAEEGRHHGQAPGSGGERLLRQDPRREDRAGLLPRPLGRRLALRRSVPRPDLRRPPDRQGRCELQHGPAERQVGQCRD